MDGEVKSKLSANGRVNFPSKLRKGLGDTIAIAKAIFVPCLQIYSLEDWEIFETSILEKNHPDIAEQLFRFMNKQKEDIDKQGRFFIPAPFCKHAKLEPEKEVVFNTVGKKVEIWNKELWDKNSEETDIAELRLKVNF